MTVNYGTGVTQPWTPESEARHTPTYSPRVRYDNMAYSEAEYLDRAYQMSAAIIEAFGRKP